MKIEIRQSLGLHQILAPQLIQSLKMLQMPILKLEQTLRQELAINPLLEEIDEMELEQEKDTLEAPEPEIAQNEPAEDSGNEKIDWDSYLAEDDEGYKVREQREQDENEHAKHFQSGRSGGGYGGRRPSPFWLLTVGIGEQVRPLA